MQASKLAFEQRENDELRAIISYTRSDHEEEVCIEFDGHVVGFGADDISWVVSALNRIDQEHRTNIT